MRDASGVFLSAMEEPVMSESVSEGTAPVEAEAVQGDPAELGDGGKKALDAERRRANSLEKQLKAFQVEREASEAAKLSDLERAQKDANDAKAMLADLQSQALRQKVALEKGIPVNLVDRLRGSDEAELSADADSLLELLKVPTSPKPDPSQGAKAELALNGDGLENALRSKLGI